LAVRSPSRRPGARLWPANAGLGPTGDDDMQSKRPPSCRIGRRQGQEADNILRQKLPKQGRPKIFNAWRAQVLIEVAERGRQWKRLDAAFRCPGRQSRRRAHSGWVRIARDIEASDRARQK